MKFKLLLAFSFWMLLVAVSCNKDDITFDAPSQQLAFQEIRYSVIRFIIRYVQKPMW
jgi:hypothetical protein